MAQLAYLSLLVSGVLVVAALGILVTDRWPRAFPQPGAVTATVVVLVAIGAPVAAQAPPIPLPTPPDGASRPPAAASQTAAHTVVRGEHLWSIAADRLADGRPEASAEEIAPYWRQVIAVNTPRLRSGDPDLIYPGEVVELPALSPEGS